MESYGYHDITMLVFKTTLSGRCFIYTTFKIVCRLQWPDLSVINGGETLYHGLVFVIVEIRCTVSRNHLGPWCGRCTRLQFALRSTRMRKGHLRRWKGSIREGQDCARLAARNLYNVVPGIQQGKIAK